MINWKVRFRNKAFWLAFIPAVIMVVKTFGHVLGFELDLTTVNADLSACVDAVFMLLAVIGIVVDPTTDGIYDSYQALTYDEPKKDGEM